MKFCLYDVLANGFATILLELKPRNPSSVYCEAGHIFLSGLFPVAVIGSSSVATC